MPEHKNILVVLPNWVGDAVMATPALRALRRRWPIAKIYLMGKPVVLETVSSNSIGDECVPAAGRGIRGLLKTAGWVRRQRIDLAVLLPNSFRSAAVAWLGRAKCRLGYNRDGRGLMLTRKLNPPRDDAGKLAVYPALQYYIDLIESLGIEVADRSMTIAAEAAPATEVLTETGYDSARPLVMLNPGGAFGPSKLWPMDRYAALADALIDRHDAQIIINAAPNERQAVAAVAKAMKHQPLLDFAERDNSIALLKSLMQRCRLLVTNDTGTRHIAVALGIDAVTIFGSTDPNWTTLDCPRERLVQLDVPCGPCQQKHCPLPPGPEYHQCLEKLNVATVLAAAEELLAGNAEVRK
ncbi:MAG: lipopolysaccharide heptosyltransferase II [Phycisphaerae bacterium]|nr:lipopolysaccharide heptosyltransferase II [Phycisphaerae bacterium]